MAAVSSPDGINVLQDRQTELEVYERLRQAFERNQQIEHSTDPASIPTLEPLSQIWTTPDHVLVVNTDAELDDMEFLSCLVALFIERLERGCETMPSLVIVASEGKHGADGFHFLERQLRTAMKGFKDHLLVVQQATMQTGDTVDTKGKIALMSGCSRSFDWSRTRTDDDDDDAKAVNENLIRLLKGTEVSLPKFGLLNLTSFVFLALLTPDLHRNLQYVYSSCDCVFADTDLVTGANIKFDIEAYTRARSLGRCDSREDANNLKYTSRPPLVGVPYILAHGSLANFQWKNLAETPHWGTVLEANDPAWAEAQFRMTYEQVTTWTLRMHASMVSKAGSDFLDTIKLRRRIEEALKSLKITEPKWLQLATDPKEYSQEKTKIIKTFGRAEALAPNIDYGFTNTVGDVALLGAVHPDIQSDIVPIQLFWEQQQPKPKEHQGKSIDFSRVIIGEHADNERTYISTNIHEEHLWEEHRRLRGIFYRNHQQESGEVVTLELAKEFKLLEAVIKPSLQTILSMKSDLEKLLDEQQADGDRKVHISAEQAKRVLSEWDSIAGAVSKFDQGRLARKVRELGL